MISLAQALQELLTTLDKVSMPYLIGGSVASGSYGLPRQTNDIDVLADFHHIDTRRLFELLQQNFYVDAQSAAESIRDGRPFNVIHLKGAFKFDFFPAEPAGFSQAQLARKRYVVSALPGLEDIEFPIASAEDTVLAKLLWYRMGGEVSERQWHDILGVLKVQAARLDQAYLTEWASRLHVSDLLEKALREGR